MAGQETERVYDELLVTLARSGDRAAANRLAARWYPRLMRTALRLVQDRSDAEQTERPLPRSEQHHASPNRRRQDRDDHEHGHDQRHNPRHGAPCEQVSHDRNSDHANTAREYPLDKSCNQKSRKGVGCDTSETSDRVADQT